MKYFFVLIFLFLTGLQARTQANLDSALLDIEKYDHQIFNSRTYILTNKKTGVTSKNSMTFESQGMYHSTYLILNDDSTYIYYSVYEAGADLTVGKWTQTNSDTLLLNWDRQRTLNCIKDRRECEKYFDFPYPSFVPMTNWRVRRTHKAIEPI